jgi:hypothetical protein
MKDPRPDLAGDSELWTMLLQMARDKSLELASNLHGMRCCGLRLDRRREGFVLRPDMDPNTSKWPDKESYLADRDRWLMPYAKEIDELLQQLKAME